MSVLGSVRGRVLAIGVACGVLGVVCVGVLSIPVSRRLLVRSSAPLLEWLMDHGERARCERDPAHWRMTGPVGAPIDAYDAATLVSHNPDSPPLSSELRDQLAHGDRALVLFGVGKGGVLAVRTAATGACAVMSSTWPPTSSPGELYGFFLAVGVLVAVLGAAMAAIASARPLRELARANAQIRAHVDELSRRRDELRQQIADVAHDVRTPIASLQLALEQALDADDPEAAECDLMRAVHDVVYVGGLIGNLRLASELRAGALGAVTAVELGEIVERAAVRAQGLARRKRIALEVALPDGGLTVTGDPIAIAQAVGNVIDNAVAHHHAGGHIAVVLEARADGFALAVIDDGPGVEPTELPRLGERTFRSDAARGRDGRGQGLGLAITAEVCRRHSWTLAFAREQPQGLRVTITGPRAASAA